MLVIGGDAIVDLIDRGNQLYEACPGGSTLNCALAAGQLGADVLYVSTLSRDLYGQLLADRLAACNVRLREHGRSDAHSSLAIVSIDQFNQPNYAFYREATADREVPVDAIIASFPETMGFLHVGSCALIPRQDQDAWLAVARSAKQHGACLSVDPNCRPSMTDDPQAYRQGIARFFHEADLIKLSDEDLRFLHPDWGMDAMDRFMGVYQPRLCVLTQGPEGLRGMTRNGVQVSVSAYLPGPLGDTVGAGDCVQGTLLAECDRLGLNQLGLEDLDQSTLTALLTTAAKVAGINCTRVGCQPPSRQELATIDAC